MSYSNVKWLIFKLDNTIRVLYIRIKLFLGKRNIICIHGVCYQECYNIPRPMIWTNVAKIKRKVAT